MILKTCIEKLLQRQHLEASLCQAALETMFTADVNALQAAAFLTLLRAKGETVDELLSFMAVLKEKMHPVVTPHAVLDIVGTGGDGAHSINISTASAILAASCGIKIAKHGNRAVSSQAGSADVLEALGVKIELTAERVSACIEEVGIGFCYAPHFHPALRTVAPLRKQLHVPTFFNLVAPLLNPANPAYVLLGVYDEALLPLLAQVSQQTGIQRAMIFHSHGLDELTCLGITRALLVTQETITECLIEPNKLGLSCSDRAALRGYDAETNAKLLISIYANKAGKHSQAITNTLILNAACALYLYGRSSSIEEAVGQAKEHLFDGSAYTLLKKWIEFSHEK